MITGGRDMDSTTFDRELVRGFDNRQRAAGRQHPREQIIVAGRHVNDDHDRCAEPARQRPEQHAHGLDTARGRADQHCVETLRRAFDGIATRRQHFW
jgi:hypothetical protein